MAIQKNNAFRSKYQRELKKVSASEKSGAGIKDIYRSSLWYYNDLAILQDQQVQQDGISSMDNEAEESKNETSLDDP
ncbi:hypothetical protein SK128_000045, partial [Halocaridina rubra]